MAYICVYVCVCVCTLKLLSWVQLFVAPWTIAHQAPLPMEFSRQKYWSGLLFPSPGDFPNPGLICVSCVSCIGRWIIYWWVTWEATWCEEPTHWKKPWCWERLRSGGEGDDRRWDGWMASLIQWIWTRANSGRWWRTGKPSVLQSIGLQRVGNNWAT